MWCNITLPSAWVSLGELDQQGWYLLFFGVLETVCLVWCFVSWFWVCFLGWVNVCNLPQQLQHVSLAQP